MGEQKIRRKKKLTEAEKRARLSRRRDRLADKLETLIKQCGLVPDIKLNIVDNVVVVSGLLRLPDDDENVPTPAETVEELEPNGS